VNVCFFNRSYHPEATATGQLLTELAEDLVAVHGWNVTVVTGPSLTGGAARGETRGWLVDTETENGVIVHRARAATLSRAGFAGRATNYLTYFLGACATALRLPRHDVVVALTDPPIVGLAALIAARRARAPFVYWCQDVFPEVAALLEDFQSPTANRLLDRIGRFIVRRVDRVVAVGETMRDRLVGDKGADPGAVTVIHNWADCAAVVPGDKRNPFSTENGLVDAFVVMHSGNIGLSQDLGTLLEAATRLRAYPDIVVAIVGDGVKREPLGQRAREMGLGNVRFLPHQPRERLADLFASADVFVVSLKRGLAGYIVPSKLYGILAAGRPYVAAVEEACEVAAITRRHGCGLLSEPGSGEDLAEKILALYRDPAGARDRGRRARQVGLEFDRRRQVARYDELFRAVVRARTTSPSVFKRPFDVLLSGLGLLASSPLWAAIALLIKLEDGGPVFYRQDRVGKNGHMFKSVKFRSMVEDADRRFGPLQASAGDPRVTRVGRVLRATAMDELPQLWNIWKGEMSFVGPRALVPEEIEARAGGPAVPLARIPGYEERQRVTPGLTGIAQVYAPRDIPRRQKFRLDRLYVRNQSFRLDLGLIALSVWISGRARWESRARKV
jgi:lipopolysaccharide/colanic/teichoic acid biosynthesis glycosyltransferase/glycosyltransferase involved in cell wall biosynthesis